MTKRQRPKQRINHRYGYLKGLIKSYPFTKEFESIKANYLYKNSEPDENFWIRGSNFKSEGALSEVLKLEQAEQDSEYIKLQRLKKVLDKTVAETPRNEWRFIQAVYKFEIGNVEEMSLRYFNSSKNKGYSVIESFGKRYEHNLLTS